jgi:hypothetical protein
MDTSTVAQNPYINDFCQNLENLEFDILNKNIRGNPLFPLIRYIFDADIFIFHWIENVPVYKKGFLQFIYAIVLLVILKLLGKKIVWFCHNKKVHGLKNKIQETESNHLLYLIKKKSTHIFTHSKEGLEILNKYNHKSIYLMHPTKNRLTNYEFSKKYDLLIWGSISKYKGILEFLSEVKSNPKLQSLKIKIIGNCEDRVLLDKINNSLSTNISFENRSISFEELNTLRASIEFVLITYKTETVLSSAILMDSLSFGFSIIAPDTAVFRELKNENRVNVKTYKNFSSVPDLIEESKEIVNYENFLSEYSWPDFTKNMSNTLFKN